MLRGFTLGGTLKAWKIPVFISRDTYRLYIPESKWRANSRRRIHSRFQISFWIRIHGFGSAVRSIQGIPGQSLIQGIQGNLSPLSPGSIPLCPGPLAWIYLLTLMCRANRSPFTHATHAELQWSGRLAPRTWNIRCRVLDEPHRAPAYSRGESLSLSGSTHS